MYNNILKPSQFFSKPKVAALMGDFNISGFSFFRDDITPEWEDVGNKMGSEWGCKQYVKDIDTVLQNLMLACVGEKLDCVTGVRIVDKSTANRSIHKIEIWMSETADTVATYSQIVDILHPISLHLSLQSHRSLTSR